MLVTSTFLVRTGQLARLQRRTIYLLVTGIAFVAVIFVPDLHTVVPFGLSPLLLAGALIGFPLAAVAMLRAVRCPSCKRQLVLRSMLHERIGNTIVSLYVMRECPACGFLPPAAGSDPSDDSVPATIGGDVAGARP